MENAKENPMEITITDTAAAKLRELLGLQDSGARIRLKPITVGCC
jgi:Fe-S cluster assembly iron-binding protein IscA